MDEVLERLVDVDLSRSDCPETTITTSMLFLSGTGTSWLNWCLDRYREPAAAIPASGAFSTWDRRADHASSLDALAADLVLKVGSILLKISSREIYGENHPMNVG